MEAPVLEPEQPKTKKKSTILQRSTRKAPAIKNAVVARRLSGEPISKIAKDVGLAVNTVKSIINLTDVDKMMEDGRAGAMNRIPQALKTLDVRLEKNSESAAIWLLDKCFENQQQTGKKMASDTTLNQTLNILLHGDNSSKEPQNVTITQTLSDTPTDK